MKLASWICASATAIVAIGCAPAYADPPRSASYSATRTTPRLDQNNYVAGAMGKVYATQNFTTDMPDETLIPLWQTFITAKHPAPAGSATDNSCYPENARRAKINTFGDVKNLSVNWTPATSTRK